MIAPTQVTVDRATSVHRQAVKRACMVSDAVVLRAGDRLVLATPTIREIGKRPTEGQVYEWPPCSSAAVARVAHNTFLILSLGANIRERVSIAIEHAEAARWAALRRERKHR